MDDDTVTYLRHEDQVNITSSDAETVTVTFIEAGQITFCFILYSIVFKSLWIEQFYLHILLSPSKLHWAHLVLQL